MGARTQAGKQVFQQFAHGADGAAKRQRFATAEEQTALDVTLQGKRQLGVNAELAMLVDAIAPAALDQAIEPGRAGALFGNGL